MKKHLYLLGVAIFCFVAVCSGCSGLSNGKSNQMEIINSEKYYRIYKESFNQICYEIYNSAGEIVLSEKTEQPLEINMINDNIIDIKIGMGTGITIHRYYDVDRNAFSQKFSYVLSYADELIAYIDVPKENPLESRKVIVQNIFDTSLFYKEFQIDFSNVDTPVIEAKFSNHGKFLQLTYLSGKSQVQTTATFGLIQ